jgi:hypothetical protein
MAFFLIAPIKRIDWTQIRAQFNFYSESRWSIGRVEMTLPPGLRDAVRCGTMFLLFLPLKPLSGAPLRGLIFWIAKNLKNAWSCQELHPAAHSARNQALAREYLLMTNQLMPCVEAVKLVLSTLMSGHAQIELF